ILTGEPIPAARAAEICLGNSVLPVVALLDTARDLADRRIQHAPTAVAACLRAVTRGINLPSDECEQTESRGGSDHQHQVLPLSAGVRQRQGGLLADLLFQRGDRVAAALPEVPGSEAGQRRRIGLRA
ncbi:hypothetical protein VM98_34110, partial [Streptomyces rubellomurinus subsp. indigoferus]